MTAVVSIALTTSSENLCSSGLPGWPSKFENLLSRWPFLKVYGRLYGKIQNLSFLKTDFGIFYLEAPGNSDAI